jgi:hypothetical protein
MGFISVRQKYHTNHYKRCVRPDLGSNPNASKFETQRDALDNWQPIQSIQNRKTVQLE